VFSFTCKDPAGHLDPAVPRAVRVFRDHFGDDPALVQREVSFWARLHNEPKDSPIHFPDESTSLHMREFVPGAAETLFDNLVQPRNIHELRNEQAPLYQFVAGHPGLHSISFHIGAACEGVEFSPAKTWQSTSPVLPRDEVQKRIVGGLTDFARLARKFGYQGPLLCEHLDYEPEAGNQSCYDHVTDPDFVAQVVQATGFQFILDPAHLLCTTINRGLDYKKYLIKLLAGSEAGPGVGFDNLREIHLAVPTFMANAATGGPRTCIDIHRTFRESLHSEEADHVFKILGLVLSTRAGLQETAPLVINFETPLTDLGHDVGILTDFISRVLGQ
jgi:hypothetical protein